VLTTFYTYFHTKTKIGGVRWCEVVWRPSPIHPICIQSTEKVEAEIRGSCSTLILLVTAVVLLNVFGNLNTGTSCPTEGMDIVHVYVGCHV
jgi:hypothetical protein